MNREQRVKIAPCLAKIYSHRNYQGQEVEEYENYISIPDLRINVERLEVALRDTTIYYGDMGSLLAELDYYLTLAFNGESNQQEGIIEEGRMLANYARHKLLRDLMKSNTGPYLADILAIGLQVVKWLELSEELDAEGWGNGLTIFRKGSSNVVIKLVEGGSWTIVAASNSGVENEQGLCTKLAIYRVREIVIKLARVAERIEALL